MTPTQFMTVMTLVNLGLVVINLMVLGFGLKLYTEIFKNSSMDRRHKKDTP